MVALEQERKIAYLKRTLDIPKNSDKNKYCKLYLNNSITLQIKDEAEKQYQDVCALQNKKPISEKYDLGDW